MPAHKHAHLMAEYAKDALETDRPWERWEILINGKFIEIEGSPSWREECKYRRKPRTISINGYEVPEPVREPLNDGEVYFTVTLEHNRSYYLLTWMSIPSDYRRLELGLIHLTKEAAIAHAKALLSFTQKD